MLEAVIWTVSTVVTACLNTVPTGFSSNVRSRVTSYLADWARLSLVTSHLTELCWLEQSKLLLFASSRYSKNRSALSSFSIKGSWVEIGFSKATRLASVGKALLDTLMFFLSRLVTPKLMTSCAFSFGGSVGVMQVV